MHLKMILLVAMIVLSLVTDVTARPRVGSRSLVTSSAERQAIRATHILDRPDRPGHFYGNTVRRRARHRR